MSRTLSITISALLFALVGCEFGPSGDLAATPEPAPVDDTDDAIDGPDLMDDDAVAAVDERVATLLEPVSTPDIVPGLETAEEWLRAEVAEQLGTEGLTALPDDLTAAFLARPSAGDSIDDEARHDSDASLCEAAAVIAGIWLDGDNEYYGLWWAPSSDVIGPMAGVYRGLATPGGQWAGGFGTFEDRLGPQGGLYFRDFDGTGTFGGMWSAPASPYEGTMGGHWVRTCPWGGYYFGVMTVCPW